jgi:hypothetical protein
LKLEILIFNYYFLTEGALVAESQKHFPYYLVYYFLCSLMRRTRLERHARTSDMKSCLMNPIVAAVVAELTYLKQQGTEAACG